jgi:hypothetical protein
VCGLLDADGVKLVHVHVHGMELLLVVTGGGSVGRGQEGSVIFLREDLVVLLVMVMMMRLRVMCVMLIQGVGQLIRPVCRIIKNKEGKKSIMSEEIEPRKT